MPAKGTKVVCLCAICNAQFARVPSQVGTYCSRHCRNAAATIARQKKAANPAPRFWSKVDTSGDCWTWIPGPTNTGYGSFSIRGRSTTAHRASYELTHGPIPNGLFVCHRCDNPLCVRPDHLFLGTHRANMRDRDSKDRVAHGEAAANARLTVASVKEIRALAEAGTPRNQLAQQFDIDVMTVGAIVRRDTWKRVA